MNIRGRHPNPAALFYLFAALLCFTAEGALATTITNYITVQPIDVCGTVCAPINNAGQTWATAPLGAIGAISGTPGAVGSTNVTNAILNQIGVGVTFLPAVQYANPSFTSLHVDNAAATASADFSALSDQTALSQITTGLVNPTPVPLPAPFTGPGVPISSNATTINMFFVNQLVPSTPGTLYGFSWIANNGVAVAANSLTGLGQRPDTIAHEIGHNFKLTHTLDGAGPNANNVCDANCKANLMTQGSLRTTPTNAAAAITDLANHSADQLTTIAALGTNSQQFVVTDPSGLLNPIPLVNAQITPVDSSTFSAPFHVSFDGMGRPGEYLSTLTLTAPSGVFFNNDFEMANAQLDSESPPTGTVSCSSGTTCPEGMGNTLKIDFAANTFTFHATNPDFLDYFISVCQNQDTDFGVQCILTNRPDLALAGGTYTYQFETSQQVGDTIVPDEIYVSTGDLTGGGDLFSNSQNQDPSLFSGLVNADGTPFSGTYDFMGPPGNLPCTPTTTGVCPTPVLEDANPAEEDPAVPEPSSLLLLVGGLGAMLLLRRSHRRTARA